MTGAGKRRVGNTIARMLAARGYAVALHYNRSAEAAQATVVELKERGVEARALQALDLIKEYEIRRIGNGGSTQVESSKPTRPPPSKPALAAKAGPPADSGDMVFLLHVSSFKEKEHAVE